VERQAVPFRAADRGQDHRIGRLGASDGCVRQWGALSLIGATADQGFLGFESNPATILQPGQQTASLAHDFGADTVTGEQQDFIGHGILD
jgi:hypothetical protein